MEGCCVQIHGLSGTTAYNGKRGTIKESTAGNQRVIVKLDIGDTIRVKKENLCSVFCVGLPREYRIAVQHTPGKEALARAISEVDSNKFYVLYMGQTHEAGVATQHYIRVRLEFFKTAMSIVARHDREPLMRFYLSDYSQTDPGASIQFGDSMPRPAEMPAFADISSELAQSLSMFNFIAPIDLADANMLNEIERCKTFSPGPNVADVSGNRDDAKESATNKRKECESDATTATESEENTAMTTD